MSEISFGTAGLRAPMGEEPGQFNSAVVIRAAAGFAAYLRSNQQPDSGPVVVGYDARHNSARFAAETAEALAAAGLTVVVLPRPLPTPVLAFAVRHLPARAGVMITASHNPAADNGMKFYLADGAPVAPPADAAIAAAIAATPPASDVPRTAVSARLPQDVTYAYLDRAASLLEPGGARKLRVVHTALHGVAAETFRQAWAAAGFEPAIEVPEQAEPDPDFPTVAFPNPEEAGALDLAAALALRTGADLVLAHDPDGDRCAVMVPTGSSPGMPDPVTGFRALSGDEVGALLADHLLADGRVPANGVLATTIVSSSLLARIAAAAGRESALTLTGFKWLARVPRLAYAYEEALGYCVDPAAVRDKDGITAALLVAEMAALSRQRGMSLTDRLDALARRHGVHVSAARSIHTTDPSAAAASLARLVSDPPRSLAGIDIEAIQDLEAPTDGLSPTAGVRLVADGLRAIVRPSGTEPKLKIYLHASLEAPIADLAAARESLQDLLVGVGDDLVGRLTGTARLEDLRLTD